LAATRVVFARLRAVSFALQTGLSQRFSDLPVDQIGCGRRRQHEAACGVPAAGNRCIGLDFIKPRDRKLNSQRLPIENEAAHRIHKCFGKVGTINKSDFRRLPVALRRRCSRRGLLDGHGFFSAVLKTSVVFAETGIDQFA
jgi:hypothetical protein